MLITLVMIPFFVQLEINEGVLDGFKRVVQSQVPMRMVRPTLIALFLLIIYAWTSMGRVSYGEDGTFMRSEIAMTIHLISVLLSFGLAIVLVRRAVPDEAKNASPSYHSKELPDTIIKQVVDKPGDIIGRWGYHDLHTGVQS